MNRTHLANNSQKDTHRQIFLLHINLKNNLLDLDFQYILYIDIKPDRGQVNFISKVLIQANIYINTVQCISKKVKPLTVNES